MTYISEQKNSYSYIETWDIAHFKRYLFMLIERDVERGKSEDNHDDHSKGDPGVDQSGRRDVNIPI